MSFNPKDLQAIIYYGSCTQYLLGSNPPPNTFILSLFIFAALKLTMIFACFWRNARRIKKKNFKPELSYFVCSSKNSTNLWPPLNSVKFSFQVFPRATLNSKPSRTVCPSGGDSIALAPGRRVEKMDPKSSFT